MEEERKQNPSLNPPAIVHTDGRIEWLGRIFCPGSALDMLNYKLLKYLSET